MYTPPIIVCLFNSHALFYLFAEFVCNMFRSFELLARATVQVKLYSLVSALTHSILPAFLPMSAMVVSLAPFVVPIGPTACDLGNVCRLFPF